MKEHSIYHRQWLSLWLILLLTVISNMLVLTFWLADTVSSELLLISSGILILSLLALHWNHQVLLKKSRKTDRFRVNSQSALFRCFSFPDICRSANKRRSE